MADGANPSGAITTTWYGTIPMLNSRRTGDTLVFDTRNLNDPAHPTRRWIARFAGGMVRLEGGIWHADLKQTGRPGTDAEVARRAFRPAPALPPLGTLPPDNLARTPPMGWSSWNRFAEHIDDATIRAMADAMVSSGLRDAGYRYINIDDGWQGTRDREGVLQPNAKFPDMKALAEYVHGKGLKLGIYTSPGPRTCAGYEGSYGHVEQDARSFAAWGVDYVKYDLCSGEWFYADADSVQRTYYQMGAALKATGRPIIYSLCEYGRFSVSRWGRQVGGHLWRTTGDITDDYATMSDIGFTRNPKFAPAGPGAWNDPDMLEIGNGGMSDDEYRTHMTLWAMQAAPLIMGHDLRRTTPAALRLLTNRDVLAIDQDPAGVQGGLVRKAGDVEVWRKDLNDGSVAVALFNRGKRAATASALPADAGGRSIAMVRDIWSDRIVPAATRFRIPPHGVVLLRIEEPAV
ncbi:glycoside hydrolase family 27 protein [Sphingomonas sp. 1P08PE]|uniref:glycoside hydrolase family 27 protein n=1 Tax=Sphingomonas sp. 1P08PE TaxID=554122 RepID=UPI0039A16536